MSFSDVVTYLLAFSGWIVIIKFSVKLHTFKQTNGIQRN
jgi:hypothetical protein